MSKLVTLNGSNDQELLSSIFDNEIVVFEDIQGSKIWVNWDGKEFTIKPKSIGSESINLIDLAMQNYYNPAIKFFESLDIRVKSLLNRKWWFCFEYFPDNQPANIEYSRVPKNNLVLTALNKSGKYDFSIEELDEYSRLLETDCVPVVFKGKLGEETKEAIKYFLNTSEQDLEFVFGEKSFSYFFYKILNPNTQGSFLMDDDYQNPPSEALNLLEYSLKNNYDVVFTKYLIKKDSWFRNLISKLANVSAEFLLKKPGSIYFSSFKLIKKNIVNEIVKYTGPFPFIDGLILSITQNIGSFEVKHDERVIGKSGYNFYKLIKHYGNLTTNFSTIPIHLFSILGLIITVLSIFFIISIVIEKIINPSIPQGYSTILTAVFFFAGVQLLFLGLIGEYVGKILKNVNKEKHCSLISKIKYFYKISNTFAHFVNYIV
jgi:undecaprenyl-phosphate 4-deoxy-4-formamido-L-arabinose transferase